MRAYMFFHRAKDVLVVFGITVTGTNPLLGVSKELSGGASSIQGTLSP